MSQPASYYSFIHSVVCLTTGPKPPPKWFLHIVRSRASYFKWVYPLLSLRSSSSFLRLLPRLLATSISPFIFPWITCFRRQFLCDLLPEASKFQHHTMPCSKCSILLVSSSNLSPIASNSYYYVQKNHFVTFSVLT